MAHFAEIDENNVVIRVVVVPDNEEHRGEEYLAVDCGLGGRWLQTSYNTNAGTHLLGGTPYRINYAGKGMVYSEELDGFIHPKPVLTPSWVLDEATGRWFPPIPFPDEENEWFWHEDTLSWELEPAQYLLQQFAPKNPNLEIVDKPQIQSEEE